MDTTKQTIKWLLKSVFQSVGRENSNTQASNGKSNVIVEMNQLGSVLNGHGQPNAMKDVQGTQIRFVEDQMQWMFIPLHQKILRVSVFMTIPIEYSTIIL